METKEGRALQGGCSNPKVSSLNGIKAIAMIMLFWWHSPIKPQEPDIGARMCEIFFVMSGFLVGINHWDVHTDNVFSLSGQYWWKKIFKVWPLHCIAFIIDCSSSIIRYGSEFITRDNAINAVINLGLIQAWSNDSKLFFSFNGATWFLSALLFCYMMSFFVISILREYKKPLFVFSIIVGVRVLCELLNTRWGWNGITFNYHVSPIIRLLEFTAGLAMTPLFFCLNRKIKDKNTYLVLFTVLEVVVIALYVICIVLKNATWIRGYFVLTACALIFIFAFNRGCVCKLLSAKPFSWFSSIQLNFFILHQAVIHFFARCFPNAINSPLLLTIIQFLVVARMSIFYQKVIEKKASKGLELLYTRVRMFVKKETRRETTNV